MFCNSHQMATALVRVLDSFDPPVTAKHLKLSRARSEKFVRGNFQGTSFPVVSKDVPNDIISIAKRLRSEEQSRRKASKG